MTRSESRILAITPVSRGLGVVVIEDGKLIDWRTKEIRARGDKSVRAMTEADRLFDCHLPSVLVLEDHAAKGAQRRRRIRELLDMLKELAIDHGIGVAHYSRADVRAALGLGPDANKDAIAQAVAERLPELSDRLPKARRPWETERHAMPIFTAASLALTHLSGSGVRA